MKRATDSSRRQGVHRFSWLAGVGLFALATAAQAGTFNAFGPQDVVHPRGRPTTETFEFDVLAPGGPYLLRLHNGGIGGGLGSVPNARVWLNGVLVVQPSDLGRGGSPIEKPVTLAASNTLTVRLAGRAGGVSVEILGEDDDPPAITAMVSPEPNPAGWHNQAALAGGGVAVSFDCSDATSGIASCSAPVVVDTEGANQVVTGQATDLAGNTSQVSVAISIDATPPDTLITSPAGTVSGFSFLAAGSVSDALSGVAAAELNGTPLELDSSGGFSREIDAPDAGTYAVELTALDVAGNEALEAVAVFQEKTEYVEIEVVYPAAGDAVSTQRETGWPLSLRLRPRNLAAIAVGEEGAEGLVFPSRNDRAFLVFDSGADGFFEPLCGFPENMCDLNSPPPQDGEVYLEFTLDTDRAGVEDAFGNDEVRDLTDSGELGVPIALLSIGGVPSLVQIGPATGGDVTDGYGYGPNDDLPGLVVLSDTGAGVVFTEELDLVEPREARNLAGFFDTVSYELSNPPLGTSVIASMTVPRHLFSPFTLYDWCPGTSETDCPIFTSLVRQVLARTDGGPVVGPVSGVEIKDEINAREVTLTIFAVNGTAPVTLGDEDGDGRVDSADAQLAGFELLSRETTLRFKQFYDLINCVGDNYADFGLSDLDASGADGPLEAICPPGAGGLVDPPPPP